MERRGNVVFPCPGDEPPAVVSLLAGRLDQFGFGATLVDLAIRGWFQVITPAQPTRWTPGQVPEGSAQSGQARAWPTGPAMCVVAAETPGGPLAPFERRVVEHVALRAGARGVVPAPALSDGFIGGEAEFMTAFRGEVDAEARRRGLTRPRLGTRRRRSAAGQAALNRWRSAVAGVPGGATNLAASCGGGRLLAYAAALGTAPAAAAVFAPAGPKFAPARTKMAWSSYRGGWQQIEIERTTWPWPRTILFLLAMAVGPVLYFMAAIWLGTSGMATQAEELVGLVVAGTIAAIGVWGARRTLFPRFAEFDGQVIRQWVVKGDSESPDQYHVAIDDGAREVAWNLTIGSEPYRRLTPGTFVHARVNLRNREQVSVQPVEPPPLPRQFRLSALTPASFGIIDFNQY